MDENDSTSETSEGKAGESNQDKMAAFAQVFSRTQATDSVNSDKIEAQTIESGNSILKSNETRTLATESETNEKRKCCKYFNTKLVVYKGFYFFFFSAIGSLLPYLTVFYKQLGLSAHQTGLLIGVRPVIQLLAQPMWGSIADTYKRSKVIFIMSLVGWLTSYYSISLVATRTHLAPCKDNGTIGLMGEILNQQEYLAKTSGRRNNVDERSKRLLNNTLYQNQNIISSDKTVSSKPTSKPKPGMPITERSINENISDSDLNTSVGFLTGFVKKISRTNKGIRGNTDMRRNRIKRLLNIEKSINLRLSSQSNQADTKTIQEAFNREQEEKIFDFLNMEGRYPWPLDTVANYDSTQESRDWHAQEQTNLFTVLFVITVSGILIAAPSVSLADTATLRNLECKEEYGKQRLWGPIGYGLGAFVVGSSLTTEEESQHCNSPLHVEYMPCFYAFAVLMGVAVVMGIFFDFDEDSAEEGNVWKGLKILCDCQHIYFILTLLYCGFALGIIQTFLFWHLQDLGGTQFLFSCIAAVQCSSEVTMYLFSGILIRRFGYVKLLYAGLVCYIIRFWLYAFVTNSWLVLPFELLYGISTAGVWSAAVCYVGLIPGASSTMQGIIGGVHWGIGLGGGGVIGGFVVTYIGVKLTFAGLAVLSMVDLALYILVTNCQCCQVNCLERTASQAQSSQLSGDNSLLSYHDDGGTNQTEKES